MTEPLTRDALRAYHLDLATKARNNASFWITAKGKETERWAIDQAHRLAEGFATTAQFHIDAAKLIAADAS